MGSRGRHRRERERGLTGPVARSTPHCAEVVPPRKIGSSVRRARRGTCATACAKAPPAACTIDRCFVARLSALYTIARVSSPAVSGPNTATTAGNRPPGSRMHGQRRRHLATHAVAQRFVQYQPTGHTAGLRREHLNLRCIDVQRSRDRVADQLHDPPYRVCRVDRGHEDHLSLRVVDRRQLAAPQRRRE